MWMVKIKGSIQFGFDFLWMVMIEGSIQLPPYRDTSPFHYLAWKKN
jgi:hypothetical protein